MLKRGFWIAALAAFLVAGGAVHYLLNVVFLEDRRGPLPKAVDNPPKTHATPFPLTPIEKPPKKRRGPPSALGTNVVLAVLETTPGGGGKNSPPSLDMFLRESVSFPRFYTSDIRSGEAMRDLLFSRSAGPSTDPGSISPMAWPRTLKENGYRTWAVGAFSDDMRATLTDAGFDDIHLLPHDGYDSLRAVGDVSEGVRDPRRGPILALVYFRDLPLFRWAPARFWVSSLRADPWLLFRFARWKRATDAAYIDDVLGRLAENLNGGPKVPLLAIVSLRGSVEEPTPVEWPRTGRRGNVFIDEIGWGLRESEIRTLFALRQGDRWPQALCRSLGQLPDVGPTLLGALDLPAPAGSGQRWNLEAASLSEETSGRWVVRSPRAKALIVDGRYKYIRHGPSAIRSNGTGTPVRIDFPTEEIFDLWTDPGERRNLTRSRRHLLARLREVLSEAEPDPVNVRLDFLNPLGALVEGRVTCSAGAMTDVGGTLPVVRGGAYEFSFSTTAPAGSVTFRTWPPDSSYSMRFAVGRRPLPSGQFRVSRWGLPLFESLRNEWIDKTQFGWMDGWAPPVVSTVPVASLGRVLVPSEGAGRHEVLP